MNSQELRALQEAYSQVYELDEVKGIEGHINPNTGKSFYGLDSGLAMTPKKRMETRANSLQKKGEGKRANKIRAVMKRPSMEESFDLYDIILSHLLDEGYADTEQAAEAIMVNMSEDWRESIMEEVLDEGQKKYPTEKVENAGNRKVRTLRDPNISPEKRLKTTKQLNTITTSFMSHLTNRPQPVPPKRKNN
jgi:chemotaxis response regulator CheB